MSRGSQRPPAPVLIGDPERARDRVLIPPGVAAPERPPSDLVWAFDGPDWSVRLVPPPRADQTALKAEVEAELDAAARLFDPTDPASEISRFNAAPEGFWALSAPFWTLLNAAMDLGDDTNGAFDPTLGALAALWATDAAPSDEAIAEALAVSGWNRLRLNREARAARQPGGMKLDVSAILAGWTADRIGERLARAGAASHLIQVGDALKGVGVKPDGQPWWVEIGHPPGSPAPRTAAALFGLAFAAAGAEAALDGPAGRPADKGVAAVGVFDASAARADALAHALTVMGPDEGLAFAQAFGLAAHLTWQGPDGLEEGFTTAYAAMMAEDGT